MTHEEVQELVGQKVRVKDNPGLFILKGLVNDGCKTVFVLNTPAGGLALKPESDCKIVGKK